MGKEEPAACPDWSSAHSAVVVPRSHVISLPDEAYGPSRMMLIVGHCVP